MFNLNKLLRWDYWTSFFRSVLLRKLVQFLRLNIRLDKCLIIKALELVLSFFSSTI